MSDLATVFGIALIAACAATDVVANGPCRDAADCVGGRCVAGRCVQADAAASDGANDFCSGVGPTVQVGDGTSRLNCSGAVAQTTFRFALCSCEGLAIADRLETDSFDSRIDAAPTRRGGAVGVNGRLDAARAAIGGALWVVEGATFRAPTQIGGDVHDGSELVSDSTLDVDGDAFVDGRVEAPELRIAGNLTQPAGAPFSVATAEIAQRVEGPVSVSPPCECAQSRLIDVADLVERRRTDNDNARIELDPSALDGFETPLELRLPCGRYYLSRFQGVSPVTLIATGRTALYVAGDLALEDRLEVRTEGAAELDLFVAGNIVTSRDVLLGSATSPSRVRLYVGGSGSLQLSAGTSVAGHLYAPRAELVVSADFEAYGSVFVRRLAASGPVNLHYDRAVLDLGDACPGEVDQCDDCTDCGNQACIAGRCDACRSNEDCCAPLACFDGRCQPQLF